VGIGFMALGPWTWPFTTAMLELFRREYMVPAPLAAAFNAHKKVVRAQDKAQDLLRSKLTPEQRKDFDDGGVFVAVGSHTGHRYMLGTGGYNPSLITVLSRESPWYMNVFCVQFKRNGEMPPPRADLVLAQKLVIENDELCFLHIANNLNGISPRDCPDVERALDSGKRRRLGPGRANAGPKRDVLRIDEAEGLLPPRG
jgi:hypothetical protein